MRLVPLFTLGYETLIQNSSILENLKLPCQKYTMGNNVVLKCYAKQPQARQLTKYLAQLQKDSVLIQILQLSHAVLVQF